MFSKLASPGAFALVGLSGLHIVEAFTCSGLYSDPQCCSTSVLGLVSLDCTPYSPITAECSSTGKTNQCCLISTLQVGVCHGQSP